MQSYVNSNQFFSFLLGATSFSDLFSRIEGVNQLTSHDKDLINRLSTNKKNSEDQKTLMEQSKDTLAALQEQQSGYQNQLNTQLDSLTEQLGYVEKEVKLTEPIINELNNAVASSKASIAEEEAYQKWLEEQQQKPSNPNTGNGNTDTGNGNNNPDNGGNTEDPENPGTGDGDSGDNSGNGGNNDNSGGESSTELGLRVVTTAYSQKGSPYVWGGKGQTITASLISWLTSAYGPSYYYGLEPYYGNTLAFDCSGLTYWAYAQLGVTIGISTYSQQNNGYAVSWDNMQAGDLILFDWDYDGLTDHVGLYAGNGMMVHTSTPNDGLGVHMINLNASSTWYNHCYTIRRIF